MSSLFFPSCRRRENEPRRGCPDSAHNEPRRANHGLSGFRGFRLLRQAGKVFEAPGHRQSMAGPGSTHQPVSFVPFGQALIGIDVKMTLVRAFRHIDPVCFAVELQVHPFWRSG